MLKLFEAYSTQENLDYEGAMIAKVRYQKFNLDINAQYYEVDTLKDNKHLCVSSCKGYFADELCEDLIVYLMRNPKINVDLEEQKIDGEYWYTFTKKEVAKFSYDTGDFDPMHLTEKPIVQGFLILKKLCELTKSENIEVRFTSPIFGGEPVSIIREESFIKGYCNNRECFNVSFDEGTKGGN